MGQIKSALELALERTKDITGDKSGLEARENREKGMKLLVKFEQDPTFDLASALKAHSGEVRRQVVAGLRQNLDGILNLPASDDALGRFRRLAPVMSMLAGNHEAVDGYLGQLEGFFDKYLTNRSQLLAAAREQYEPALRQKEEQLSRQSGRRVQLTHEQDPEFNKFLQQNLDALVAQYSRVLDPIRDEIRAILDAA